MRNWKGAFDPIQAGEELKEKTRRRAAEERARAVSADGGAQAGVHPVGGRKKLYRRAFTAAAALLVFALAAGGFRHYTITAEAAYVSVEAEGASGEDKEEPLLGLSVNRFGNVILAEGLNEAGKEVLARSNPIGKPYEEALEEIFYQASALGYLADETRVDFGVCAGSDSELVQSLQAASRNVIDTVCPYVSSGSGWVSSQTRDAAASVGMSCNRYQVAEEIMALDDTVTPEDCSLYSLCQLKCWHQALLDGQAVAPEEVPHLCNEYGYGAGCGQACPGWETNGGYGYEHWHNGWTGSQNGIESESETGISGDNDPTENGNETGTDASFESTGESLDAYGNGVGNNAGSWRGNGQGGHGHGHGRGCR